MGGGGGGGANSSAITTHLSPQCGASLLRKSLPVGGGGGGEQDSSPTRQFTDTDFEEI